MTPTIVVLLLIIAIGLILTEIFFVPGVGIPGILGLLLMLIALGMAFSIGHDFGYMTLGGAAVASVILVIFALRSKTWSRVSQQHEISGKVDTHANRLKSGERGITVSRLNPVGKARFGDEILEVCTWGEYLDADTAVEITNIEGNKITVKPINKA
ncbi:MAG: hypothetical protein Kow0075_05820 [Salibacteraceae bacterium]